MTTNSLDGMATNNVPGGANKFLNVPRSSLPESMTRSVTLIPGAIVPIDHKQLLPGEVYEVNYNKLLQTLQSLQAPSLTRWRLYTETWYIRNSDLWKQWNTHATGGATGKTRLRYPHIEPRTLADDSGADVKTVANHNTYDYCTPMSLMDYLDCPVTSFDNSNTDQFTYHLPLVTHKKTSGATSYRNNVHSYHNNFDGEISSIIRNYFELDALDYMFYQRLWKDGHLNKDLVSGSIYDEDHDENFILDIDIEIPSTSGTVIKSDLTALNTTGKSYTGRVNCLLSTSRSKVVCGVSSAELDDIYVGDGASGKMFVPGVNEKVCYLTALRFHNFKGDRFVSASPFPELMRGDIPNLNDYSKGFTPSDLTSFESTTNLVSINTNNQSGYGRFYIEAGQSTAKSNLETALRNMKNAVLSSVTQNSIKALAIWSDFRKRLANTDGSYNSMMSATFGINPHCHTHKAQYIGGSFTDINFNEVVATSDSYDGNGVMSSQLGQRTQNGMSLDGGQTMTIHSPDFGRVMTVAYILPETIYNNDGVDRTLHGFDSYDKIPYPELWSLGAETINNNEICMAPGNSSYYGHVFAYEERGAYLRTRQNRVNGMFSIGEFSQETNAMIGRREFRTAHTPHCPTFSNDFVTMSPKNIKDSVMRQFQSKTIAPFILSVGINARSIAPIPYSTR